MCISLCTGSLLSLKKSKLLKTLEDAESSSVQLRDESQLSTSHSHASMDDEYAAFQVHSNEASISVLLEEPY